MDFQDDPGVMVKSWSELKGFSFGGANFRHCILGA